MTDTKIFKFMFISVGMTLCGFILLFFFRHPTIDNFGVSDFLYVPWLVLEFFIAFFIQFIISKRKKHIWPFPCAFFLSNFGILVMSRLEPNLTIPQIRWVIVGMIIFYVILRFDFVIKKLLSRKFLSGSLCLILFAATVLFGSEINGVSNTVALGGFRFQPLEFAEILFVFFLASFMGDYIKTLSFDNGKIPFFNLLKSKCSTLCFSVLAFSIMLFIVSKDFAASFMFVCLAAIMSYIAMGNKNYAFIQPVIFILSVVVNYFIFPDVKNIFDAWLNPWAVSNETSKQIVESLFSVYSGGVWGTGFTMGNPEFIPEAHINFIFSAVGEEFGLIGMFSLIIIYLLLFYQSVSIAFGLKKEAEILLVYGVGILFFLQAFFSILSSVNLIPETNNVLPFMRYGMSATIANFILLAILVSLSRKENYNG